MSADGSVDAMTLKLTGATRIVSRARVQELWSGYGEILRYQLHGALWPSVIVKHVKWPSERNHPRAWNSDKGHARKVRSYVVESTFYRDYAIKCESLCRVPKCLALESQGDEVYLLLEDLNADGLDHRSQGVSENQLESCLAWLANFHATFLSHSSAGLWPVGTYWHLATRPEELAALEAGPLKAAAGEIDRILSACTFQTLVHGDAKLANFCFSASGQQVAAVDFQYVGGGCGIKDLAYFVSSCFGEEQSEAREDEILNRYFLQLQKAIVARNHEVDFAALESEWRRMYPLAWTDFYRFLQGWSPGHWKIHRYSARLAQEVLRAL